MAVPQFIATYAQQIYDSIKAKFQTADLPGINIDAWGPAGLSANADGSVAAFDATKPAALNAAQINARLQALGLVDASGNRTAELTNALNGTTTPAAVQLTAPTNLQAVAASATSMTVTANSVANASGYKLFGAPTSGGTYAQLGGTLTTPSYTHIGLTAATAYFYQFQTVGNGSSYTDSPRSATFSGTTSAAPATNTAPTLSNLAIAGAAQVGQTLTATYTYADADGDAEGATLFQWYRATDNAGTGRAAISGATAKTYTLVTADQATFLQVNVQPVAATGTNSGAVIKTSAYTVAVSAAGTPAAGGAGTALVLAAFDQTKIPNLSLTGDVLGGTAAGAWSGVTTKVLPLATAGWMEFVALDITKENALLIADSDTATPNGDGFYGNDLGIKNTYGGLNVISAGAATKYGTLANGDKGRMTFAADNTWQVAISHDSGQTFAAPLISGTRTTALVLKVGGADGKQLKGVSYNGFA